MAIGLPRPLVLLIAAALLFGCGSGDLPGTPPAASGAVLPETSGGAGTIVLVRHAETAGPSRGSGSDPALSAAGEARAKRLAEILASQSVEHILTTDYRRTRETAAPLAALFGIDVEIYDPGALDVLVARLRSEKGTVVVVGHSNTTPALIRLLGGDPGAPIAETEYDRLYRVELPSAKTTMQRYE